MNPQYLTGHVGVEHFAFDDKPELLPVSLAFLTPAEIATDGGAFPGGGYLAREAECQGTMWRAQIRQGQSDMANLWQRVYTALKSETWTRSQDLPSTSRQQNCTGAGDAGFTEHTQETQESETAFRSAAPSDVSDSWPPHSNT